MSGMRKTVLGVIAIMLVIGWIAMPVVGWIIVNEGAGALHPERGRISTALLLVGVVGNLVSLLSFGLLVGLPIYFLRRERGRAVEVIIES